MKTFALLTLIALFSAGCASQSIMADKEDVKVSREPADKDCQELGKVTGSSLSAKATQEEVLEDMKQNAANKGANYVVVEQYSDMGSAVTGVAYKCP